MDQEKPSGDKSLDPKDYVELINKATSGNIDAINELKRLGPHFEGKNREDIPPMYRSIYCDPLRGEPISFDDLRADREYSNSLVDDFLNKVCDKKWLPPGAAMMLFIYMCTKYKSAMNSFSGATRMKLMQVFNMWDEAHPWVKANILYRMGERLHSEYHHAYYRAFFERAREYDKTGKRDDTSVELKEEDK